MNELYLEHLDRSGLISGSKVSREHFQSTSTAELLDLAEALTASVTTDLIDPQDSIYANWATLSLSGGPQACLEINCRLTRAEQLSRFAALYSDRVFVHNEFAAYIAHPPSDDPRVDGWFREAFFNDLAVIAHLRPVIAAGRVVPVTQAKYYCRDCLMRGAFGAGAEARFARVARALRKRYYDNTTVEFYKREGRYFLQINGPEELLEHGALLRMFSDIPPLLKEHPRLVQRAQDGDRVDIADKLRRKLGFHTDLAARIWSDITFELTMSQLLGTTFLTENPLHIKLLASLTDDVDIEQRNLIAADVLTSHVPFVADVPLDDLLVLRSREEEAFVAYRTALMSTIDAYRKENGIFGARQARQLYSDVLAPKLASLDRKVHLATADMARSTLSTAASWTGAISFGWYTGILPQPLTAALAAAGAIKVGADLVAGIAKRRTDDPAKSDDLYFLWRVKQLSKRGS